MVTKDRLDALSHLRVEVPTWAFVDTGTRFKVFRQPGVPTDPFEKVDDAAIVHRLTGTAPLVALHIPWDETEDFGALRAHARAAGLTINSINSNTFQDDDFRLGSVCHPEKRVREKARSYLARCIELVAATGARNLKLWFGDGTNYPGQDDLRDRQDRLSESLAWVYERLDRDTILLIEYKLFEPSLYSMDIPDWGTAYAHCLALGDRARVVVDTGHHAPGTNIEFIVAFLLRAGRLGSFDLNSRFYADDDLMAGAADPFQLFRIVHEVVQGGGLRAAGGVEFMLDQCHNIEPKVPAVIRSVMNVQEAVAKALLVDHVALRAAQTAGDVLAANAILMDAFDTDVRRLLAERRINAGLPADPIAAYHASGYADAVRRERGHAIAASWGA